MQKATVEVIARHPLFRKLSQAQKASLLRCIVEESVTANTLIYQEDSQGDSMYVVIEGSVLLQKYVDGDPVPVMRLRPRETFGELAALLPGNRLLTAKAIDSGLIARLSHAALQQLQESDPATAYAVRSRLLEHFLLKVRHLQPVWNELLTQAVTALDGRIVGT